MLSNKEIRAVAREELSGFWTMPVLASLVYFIISSICGVPDALGKAFPNSSAGLGLQSAGLLLSIFVIIPIAYGFELSFLKFLRGSKDDTVERMFDGFKTYGRALGVTLLQALFVFLWSLLLIIPGIIKSFAYAMAVYISKDYPELSPNECLDLSQEMMDGHKMDLFLLYLSFIGWALLCILSLGIGFLWLIPYINVSAAKFYEEIKAEYENIETSEM